MDTPPSGNKKLAATIGLVVIVAAIVAAAFAFSPKKTHDAAAIQVSSSPAASPTGTTLGTSTTPSTSPAAAASTPAAAQTYKDGTYKATGTYQSPGGTEKVTVSVTLKGDDVSDSTVTAGSQDPTGQEYQAEFIASYKTFVTGKDIDTISLSKVSGSSLTSQGFNSALNQIKSQAKA